MKPSRFASRLLVALLVLLRLPTRLMRRRPTTIRRVLIAHHLLLGDSLVLTPLLAKLRAQFPDAEIVLTTPKALFALYQHAPYGVRAVAYDPRDARTLLALRRRSGFDLALLPAENRYSWLAFALGSRWIVGFEGDPGSYKHWLIDELRPYSREPTAWGDTVAELIDGRRPAAYRAAHWLAPDCAPFALPPAPYCVLHLGASTPLKLWEPEKWRALAQWLSAQGYNVVWSAGHNERHIVNAVDPEQRYPSYAGALDLAQLWRLLAGARLLISPDTGIAHLGRIIGVPTMTLFGPGSAVLCGAGDFWRDSPYAAITVDPFPCRDQHTQYYRVVEWVRRCERFQGSEPGRCPAPRCMQAITLDAVTVAATRLLQQTPERATPRA